MDNNVLLSPISLQDLLARVRDVIREEICAERKKQEEELVAPTVAAKLFQPAISPRTLWDWSKQGLVKKYRIAGRVYYKKSEIIESLNQVKRYKSKKLLEQ
jgi:hypothetical protein